MSAPSGGVKRLAASRVQCTVQVEESQRAKAEEKSLRALGKNVKVPGFRPGHAPLELLREKLDADTVREQTIRTLLPEILPGIMESEKLSPIIPPNVALTSADPLTLEITFVEKPKVNVKQTAFKVEPAQAKTDDADVEKVVQNMLREFRTFASVDRAAQTGDRVNMDFWGADAKGEKLPQVSGQGYSVVIGSKHLIPGFEDALVGLAKGAEKAFTLTFPKDYREESLQGQTVTFHATINGVEEVRTPEMTDDFVKEKFGMPSFATLKADIRKHLEEQERAAEHRRRESLLLEEIRKATVVELADELVASEVRELTEDLLEQLRRNETSLGDWLKSRNKTEAELQKELIEQAKARLTLRFGVQDLIETLQVSLTAEELDSAVAELLASLDPKEVPSLATLYAAGGRLRDQFAWQKTVEKLIAQLLA